MDSCGSRAYITRMSLKNRSFLKMHGLGNDFVVLDGRALPVSLTEAEARLLADRHFGIGCDQIVILEPAKAEGADLFVRFLNGDGSESGACGNGTRCAALLVFNERKTASCVIETRSGLLPCRLLEDGLIEVDMGLARDVADLDLSVGPLAGPVFVNMGNPHAVFVVPDALKVDLPAHGPLIENHPLFPNRTNVEAISLQGKDRLRLRVWERGAGITLACGSGACAAAVAAFRRGLTGRQVMIELDGGELRLQYLETGHVMMTGPATLVAEGRMGG
ncbi:Diaminopimelate epimerase [Rhodospirillaceae bacterium LM-1]|nr:Diaminopimelate epimerase [Rhodospirillaceae bacterium LM-1]